MNHFKIQKFIFFCLTAPTIIISPSDAYSSDLEKIRIINQSYRLSERNNLLDLKINKKEELLTNLENNQNNSTDNIQKKNIDEKINTSVNELLIESKVQSEKDNILFAEGEVIVIFKDNILKADSLIYDKKNKLAKAEGNIQLKINNQVFQADMVEYDFIENKGIFKNVKGLINFESIISDFDFNSDNIYKNISSTIKRIIKDKVVFTPNKVTNWIFTADYLKVDQDIWSSKKLI